MTEVTNPGEFKWKPTRTLDVDIKPHVLVKTTGTNQSQAIRLSSGASMAWKLEFETSKKTFDEIYNFLESKGFTFKTFTWRYHAFNKLYNVRLVDGIDFKDVSSNTGDQESINQEFSLTFTKVSEVS